MKEERTKEACCKPPPSEDKLLEDLLFALLLSITL
jgi:hypothetical protein